MNNKYYAVSGANALGVYNDFQKIKNVAEYIYGLEVHRCRSMLEAFCKARDNYNEYHLGEDKYYFYGDSSDVKLNRVYFKREISELNEC